MGRKRLYESIQALEARNKALENIIYGSTTDGDFYNKINPNIKNNLNYETVLSAADKIQASSRYITDIPELNLPSNKLECLLYDTGALCLFREDVPKVSLWAKTGSLNELGDLTEVQPIDFAGKTHGEKRTVVYTDKLVPNACVILQDYTGSYLENDIISRRALNSVSIKDQALVYRQLKNAVRITAKKALIFLEDEGQRSAMERTLNDFMYNDAPVGSLIGKEIFDKIELHNLDTKLDIEGYLRAIETYERIRANFNCIATRSPIEKKERLITSEAESTDALRKVYLYDGLINRQVAIELAKKHSIIKEGSSRINPELLPEEKESKDSDEKYSKKMEEKGGAK